MNIPKILTEIRPGAEWNMTGNDYASLNWTDAVQVKPTEAEIIAWDAASSYKGKCRAEYPPIADQVEALISGGQELADIKILINAVKAKYPKP